MPEGSCGEARPSHRGTGALNNEGQACTGVGHLLLLSDMEQLYLGHRVATDTAWLAAAFSSVGKGAVC